MLGWNGFLMGEFVFVTLERGRLHSVRSAVRDAIIVGVFPTWAGACASADEWCDDGLSAVAVCTETGRVYRVVGVETTPDWFHAPSSEFNGMTASDYLEAAAARYAHF